MGLPGEVRVIRPLSRPAGAYLQPKGTTPRSLDWPGAALIAAGTLGGLALGGLVGAGSEDLWYAALRKAPLNPPYIVFAFVWPALLALMLAGALMAH